MKPIALTRLSLPAQLTLLFSCLLILLWSLLLYDLHRLHRQTEANSRDQTANLVRAFAEEVESSVKAIDLSLLNLRDIWLDGEKDFRQAVQSHQTYLEQSVGFQIAIIDAAGMLAFSSSDPQSKPIDLSDREHFKAHHDSAIDRLFISMPVIGRVSRRWTIQFTRPLIDAGGRFAGVIVLSVAPDYFSRFYQSIDLGQGSSIALLRRTGEFLARLPNPERALGKKLEVAPFLNNDLETGGLYKKRAEVDDIERLYGWRRLDNSDLVVLLGQGLDTIYKPYRDQRKVHILVGFTLSFLLFVISYFMLNALRQRAKATTALVESEARWKLALEAAGDGVWDWDIPKNAVRFSPRWKEILGFTDTGEANPVGEWTKRIHPDDASAFRENLEQHLEGMTPTYRSEHRMRCSDGGWKWVLERGMAVSRAADGKPLRLIGTLSDVTARKQSEAALRDSMERLTSEQLRSKVILENSYDAFVAVDSTGHITDWNTKAEQVFGWPAAEVIGRDLAEVIIPEEKREAHNRGFQRYTASGQSTIISTVLEVEAMHRAGNRLPVELAVAGFFDGKGYAANAFIRDISERKEAQRIAMERNRSLEEARKALQHSQKLEALGRLTGGIAHDFNNVLQTMTTGIQVSLLLGKDPKLKSALEACQRAVQRGVELTRQLLVFGRAQDAHLKIVAPGEQIIGMKPFLQGALPSNIAFLLQLDDGLWPVQIDPLQFELALLNLTMNGRDAMPDGGQLTLSAANVTLTSPLGDLPPGDYVRVVVSDSGGGMPPELLAKALDPFFTTKAVGKGSGMGLPQAYGFARQMGGTLILRNDNGRGLEVSIYLPRSTQEAPSHPPERTYSDQAAAKSCVVLFVEDDDLVRQTVQPALEAAGFQVKTAVNGEEALAMLEAGERFDLIFSDIVMPGAISGIDLAETVRSRFAGMSVILATGYSERRLSSPDIRLLAKPYDIRTLVKTINETLQGDDGHRRAADSA